MSLSSRALNRLNKLYGLVLRKMRVNEWLMEHGQRPAITPSRSASAPPNTVEPLEQRILLTTNPIGQWSLDGELLDASGKDNHGAVTGNPAYVYGQYDSALEFDQLDGQVDTVVGIAVKR